jgi:hypothetical protein
MTVQMKMLSWQHLRHLQLRSRRLWPLQQLWQQQLVMGLPLLHPRTLAAAAAVTKGSKQSQQQRVQPAAAQQQLLKQAWGQKGVTGRAAVQQLWQHMQLQRLQLLQPSLPKARRRSLARA